MKLLIIQIQMKEGFSLKDLPTPEHLLSLTILSESGNNYTCLAKIQYLSDQFGMLEQYAPIARNFDVIFDLPGFINEEKLILSFIGENETIKALLSFFKDMWTIKVTSIQNYSFTEFDLLSILTEKQKDILLQAKERGYYQSPRGITTEGLSKQLGITKSTVIEHLRKAENRIISAVLAGYTH
ncbi:MAG: helix-turn-helix domain-containing protein [Candidatus Heimdallarchaeota archaeon]